MSDSRKDERSDRSIQIDPATCRTILAEHVPGEWQWKARAFQLDGPGELSARVRVEFDADTDTWTIEPTVCGEPLDACEAPRLGLHGKLEAVAERLRDVLIEEARLSRELLTGFIRRFHALPSTPTGSTLTNTPLGRTEWLERFVVCSTAGDATCGELMALFPALADSAEPTDTLATVLAAELLECPGELETEARRAFGERLQEVAAALEARGRALVG